MPVESPAATRRNRRLARDLRLLARFVGAFCRSWHAGVAHTPFALKGHDVEQLCGRPVPLCDACRKLLAHAWVMRTRCPLDPKPACKKCPVHCYAPTYREQMRAVMRYAGRRLILTGRLDYLLHLLF